MLALTQDAAEIIREIVHSSPAPEASTGLRIATDSVDGDEAQLSMSIVNGPETGDETVAQHGATVYVSETAAPLLADKVLDAHAHEDHVHFSIAGPDEPEHLH